VAPLWTTGSESAAWEEVQPRRLVQRGCGGTAPGGDHDAARNGRVRRASRSDERGKVALVPGMDAVCRKMPGAWARARRSGGGQTSGPHSKEFLDLNKAPNQILVVKTNSQEERKNLRKIMEVGNPIWNTFYYCNFFQIFTNFELFKRFQVNVSLIRFVLILSHSSTHCKSTRTPFWTKSSPW
jgi:hypothetical protein